MVILKFSKTSTAALVSHVDTLRTMTCLIRRAGVSAEYSRGYNPHMELGFSAPLALGVESLCEYVSIRTDFAPDLVDRLNAVAPNGLHFDAIFNAEVNLASAFDRALYKISANGIGNFVQELLGDSYSISYPDRGETVVKEVSARIFGAEKCDEDSLFVTLAIGNDSLRPDRLARHMMNTHGLSGDYSIVKIAAYAGEVAADDFLAARSARP